MKRSTSVILLLSVLVLVLAGCAKPPAPKVFYPPAPDAPRVQYLVSYSSQLDLKKGAFSRMISEQAGDLGFTIDRGHSVGFYQGKMYVIDSRLRGIAVFDMVKEKAYMLEEASKAFTKPMQLAIDKQGNKFISDPDSSQVVMIDANEEPVRIYRNENIIRPYGLAVDDKHLYITEVRQNKVHILDRQSGDLLKTFTIDNEVRWPIDVELDLEGNLLIANLASFNIMRMSPEGKILGTFGEVGDFSGSFARPKGIALDHEGRIYVLDTAFENLQLFTREGKILMDISSGGSKPENLVMPSSVIVDYDNVEQFQRFAAPGFKIEYLIAVANQRGPSRINIYGFGRMEGADYSAYEK